MSTPPKTPQASAIKRPYYVYVLSEEIAQGYDGQAWVIPFYVGVTNDPKGRYLQHLAGDENVRKTERIRLAQQSGHAIHNTIRETTLDEAESRRLEAFWILYHLLTDCPLTNTHAGACIPVADLDTEHADRLRRMLHDHYGCCKHLVCKYANEYEQERQDI